LAVERIRKEQRHALDAEQHETPTEAELPTQYRRAVRMLRYRRSA
jgi:hypothetical protein